jgi:hypothetical protein
MPPEGLIVSHERPAKRRPHVQRFEEAGWLPETREPFGFATFDQVGIPPRIRRQERKRSRLRAPIERSSPVGAELLSLRQSRVGPLSGKQDDCVGIVKRIGAKHEADR